MARIVHFELPSNDPVKLGAFYREVFDWEITKWDGPMEYYMITTGPDDQPGINGGFYRPEAGMSGVINTLEVTDLDAVLRKVQANGGRIVMPRHAIPGVGYLAYTADVEGNVVGIMQNDPNAAA